VIVNLIFPCSLNVLGRLDIEVEEELNFATGFLLKAEEIITRNSGFSISS
jgi:hypothetical protein